MYIWVLLATFLATLYSFNLSQRADMRKVEVEPVAEAVISKMVIKQQAAGRYMQASTPPNAKYTNPDGSITLSPQITYTSGIITDDEFTNPGNGSSYLPFGFNNTDDITTEIYCLNAAGTALANCALETTQRYLVAYMLIPQRWLNVTTGLPNTDFSNAMKTIIGNDSSFGYPGCEDADMVTDSDSGKKVCSKLKVRSKEGLIYEIAPYIAKSGGFGTKCGTKKTGTGLCLMYIYEYKFRYYS